MTDFPVDKIEVEHLGDDWVRSLLKSLCAVLGLENERVAETRAYPSHIEADVYYSLDGTDDGTKWIHIPGTPWCQGSSGDPLCAVHQQPFGKVAVKTIVFAS